MRKKIISSVNNVILNISIDRNYYSWLQFLKLVKYKNELMFKSYSFVFLDV